MWARKKNAYYRSMKWHLVISMETEVDYKFWKPGVGFVTEKRVRVELPAHSINQYWNKDSLDFVETVNVLQNQVCALCRRKKLKEAGLAKEIML